MAKKKETKAEKQARLEPSFLEFWEIYPRKEGKKPCFTKWLTIDPDEALFAKIIDSVTRYKLTYQWSRKEFIPMPLTYLNQERWDNEVPPPMQSRAPGGAANTRGAEKFVKEATIIIPEV